MHCTHAHTHVCLRKAAGAIVIKIVRVAVDVVSHYQLSLRAHMPSRYKDVKTAFPLCDSHVWLL